MHLRRLPSFILLFAIAVISLIGQAQTALQFVPVTPCRIADTRNPAGQFGGPAMAAGSQRDFPIPLSVCNIPNTAAAYSLNVTVVPWKVLDYLTLWPTGQSQPFISTLNSWDGRIKANAAIVPAGTSGAVSVYVTDKTDVILDIDGYFVSATSTTLAFFPLTPCRVADTRGNQGPLGGPSLQGGKERDFPMLASSCNIPNGAKGYSLNFTVVPKTRLNFLTVWPTGQSQPLVSTLNAPTGTVVANAAVVPAGLSGAISVYATDNTELIIDIDGYFGPASSGSNPLSLYVLAPCRVLDTRSTTGAFSGTLPVDVLGSGCSVPGAQAYVFNGTVVPQNGAPMGYLTLWPDAEGQPLVSTLNAYDGAVTSNMAIVPTVNGDVDAYAANSTQLIMDIFSYFAPILPLSIATPSLPSGTLAYGYSAALGAAGGVLPYTWSITTGSLPPGVNLNSGTGVISGTPTTAGSYPFTVQVADSQSPPATASAPLSITVNATLTQLTILTTSLPSGSQNNTYNAMLAATGGITPYTWSIVSGNLPAGLSLNSSTGAITGTPSGAGVSNFTVKVSDAETPAASATQPLSITITPAVQLSISTTSLPAGTQGTAYSASVTAIGGVYPYSWSIASGSLPNGLSLNSSSGAIMGTPTVVGTSNFTVQVTDSETPPVNAYAQFSITIASSGGGGDPGVLKGNYVFYLNGFNSATQWTLAGSFISDGKGNITSAMVDGNSVTGQPYATTLSGTYSISSTGLNTMTIQSQVWGPMTIAFVLNSTGNGRIIEYDDSTGQGSRASGVLRKADPTAFSLSKLNGGYVYGMAGADNFGRHMANVGVFTLASGTISNGACEMNNGQYETCTFYGSVSAIDPTTGRGVTTVQSNIGTSHQAVYVVSAGELVMEEIDSVPSTNTPLLVGKVVQQSGPFNNGSLNGNAVVYWQDIHCGDGLDQSGASIFSFAGNGSFNVVAMDEDLAGTITQDQPWQGSYSVQSNGAVSFGAGDPAGFLVGQNKAFLVGTGCNSLFLAMEPQTGGPFSNASIAGTYAAGTLAPLDYTNGKNELSEGLADGLGTLTIGGDSSSSNGVDQWFGTIVNYSIAASGRGTGQAQGDPAPSVVYMVSPNKWIVLTTNTDAGVYVFEH
jgi:hypothetical protein